MNNKYAFQKNASFILILLLSFNFTLLFITVILKVIPGILMQIVLILDVLKSKSSILPLLSTIDTYTTWIAFLLIIVLSVKMLKALKNTLLVYKQTKKFLKELAVIDIRDGTYIIQSQNYFAFTAGLIKPKVYISSKLLRYLNEEELNSISQHELYHAKSYDPLRKLFLDLLFDFLPQFPLKKALFDNQEILTELAADSYSESILKTKKGIISALSKLMDSKSSYLNFNISSFNLRNDRIKILVGNSNFKSKNLFLALFFVGSFFFFNTIVISNTNVFTQCQHIIECFQTLFSKTDNISIIDKTMCISSDKYSSQYHCLKFAQDHSSTTSSMSDI